MSNQVIGTVPVQRGYVRYSLSRLELLLFLPEHPSILDLLIRIFCTEHRNHAGETSNYRKCHNMINFRIRAICPKHKVNTRNLVYPDSRFSGLMVKGFCEFWSEIQV